MGRPKVFVTRNIPLQGLEMIREVCDVDVWPHATPPAYAELLFRVNGCSGLLTLLTDRIDAKVMAAAGQALKVISHMAVGVDNINLAAATQQNIAVGHTPGVLTETTADFAWALLMAAARRVVEADRYTRAGRRKTWEPMLLLGPDIHRSTLGIIGFGRIGCRVHAFGTTLRCGRFHEPALRKLGPRGRRGPVRGLQSRPLGEIRECSFRPPNNSHSLPRNVQS